MQLTDFYRDVLHLSEALLIEQAVNASEVRQLKAGECLIRQGEVPSHICFLMCGVIRGFVIDVNGKDITDCIAFRRGDAAMPDNDFTQPASITIEALTDGKVVCITADEVVRLLKEYPSLEELYRKLLFISSSRHRDLKMAAYQYTAIQRYQWFLTEYPGLIDKISHKHIASLLNMTPVTLSKIRKDLKKGKTDAALAVFSAESSGEACPPKTR